MTTPGPETGRIWGRRRTAKRERLAAGGRYADGKMIDPKASGLVLESVIHPGDKVSPAVRLMPELGITATVEMPPGHILTTIRARETPAITSMAIDDVGTVAALFRARKASEP